MLMLMLMLVLVLMLMLVLVLVLGGQPELGRGGWCERRSSSFAELPRRDLTAATADDEKLALGRGVAD